MSEKLHFRVVAPSRSWQANDQAIYRLAAERLKHADVTVSYGEHVQLSSIFQTAPAELRAQDLNRAFSDGEVDVVMALDGGWSANEVLPLLDWKTIKENPKPYVGYSDNTVLVNAIAAKTNNVALLGPNFSTLGESVEWQYTLEHLLLAVSQRSITGLEASTLWSSDRIEIAGETKWNVFQSGQAKGALLGGNLGSFYLLQGTEYMPSFDRDFIFVMEDDDEAGSNTPSEVARRFESLLQQHCFIRNLRGLIVGRFESSSGVTAEHMLEILKSKSMRFSRLGDIPIVSEFDTGHTLPMATLPINGVVELTTTNRSCQLWITFRGNAGTINTDSISKGSCSSCRCRPY